MKITKKYGIEFANHSNLQTAFCRGLNMRRHLASSGHRFSTRSGVLRLRSSVRSSQASERPDSGHRGKTWFELASSRRNSLPLLGESICLPECGRPRPQQLQHAPARRASRWPRPAQAFLRPGTGALRGPIATLTRTSTSCPRVPRKISGKNRRPFFWRRPRPCANPPRQLIRPPSHRRCNGVRSSGFFP